MNIETSLVTIFQSGVLPTLVVGTVLWNSDKTISAAGAIILYKAIKGTAEDPSQSEVKKFIDAFLNKYFSLENGPITFTWNVLLLTMASLVFMLSIYTWNTPGLSGQLLSRGFLAQFFGNGFVVTFLVNCCIFMFYPFFSDQIAAGSPVRNLIIFFLDVMAKVALFTFLTAITYVLFAIVNGAFGGDPLLAISRVPITLFGAARFENLTAVYLYSVTISSFPIFVVILIKLMLIHPRLSRTIRSLLFWLPFETKPLRAISIVFALSSGVFALTVACMMSLLK